MLKLNLKKPIVFFDLEATGLNVVTDRIVQIAMIKYFPGKAEPETIVELVNPEMPISEEAIAVHGITNAQAKEASTFQEQADRFWTFVEDADLAGYNSDRYDIPMLMEEFARAGYDLSLDDRKTIDVQQIFYKKEPRTLEAAYRFYCNKKLEGAHDALVDVVATVEVLNGQIDKYTFGTEPSSEEASNDGQAELFGAPTSSENTVEEISAFTKDKTVIDVTRRLKYNDKNEVVFNFGKYKGMTVRSVFSRDPQYYEWIIKKDFSTQVKKMVKKIKDGLTG